MSRLVTLGLMAIMAIVVADGKVAKTTLPPPTTNSTANQTVIETTTEEIELTTTTTEDPSRHVALGGRCSYNYHCIASFSICENGTCQCQPNFKAEGKNSCLPTVLSCPGGKEVGAKPVICQVYADPASSGFLPSGVLQADADKAQKRNGQMDSCPKGFFCALSDKNTVGSGHCCPDETPWCPVGKPDLSRTCNSGDGSAKPFCSYDTQECHQVSLNGRVYAEFCCPKPCQNNQILRKNLCFSVSRLGENCELNDQCQDSHAECRNGTCVCQKHHYLNEEGRSCERAYCPSTTEGTSEPQVDKNGDILRCNVNSSVCTGNSYCSANGYICCPKPVAKCSSSNSDSTGGQQGKVVCDTNLANNCPSGQYCQSWIQVASRTGPNAERVVTQNLGICC